MASEERFEYLPEVPTFKEQGYDYSGTVWRGIVAPKGTPREIVEKINEAIMKVSETEGWLEFQEKNYQVNDPVTPKELDEDFQKKSRSEVNF